MSVPIYSLLLLIPLLHGHTDGTQGYLDAGTSSLIIQFLIAVLAGGLFLLKVFWSKVKLFLSKARIVLRKGISLFRGKV